jgi:hypothetical protein
MRGARVPMVIYLRAAAQACPAGRALASLSQLADTGLAIDIDATPALPA